MYKKQLTGLPNRFYVLGKETLISIKGKTGSTTQSRPCSNDASDSDCNRIAVKFKKEFSQQPIIKSRVMESNLNKIQIQDIEDIVSVYVSPQHLSFCHIKKGYEIIDWQVTPLVLDKHNNSKLSLLNLVKEIVWMIPPASVYVFEDVLIKAKHIGAVPVITRTFSTEAMTMASLSCRSDSKSVSVGHSPIVLLKAKAVGDHFELKLGTKYVSGQPVIDDMIKKEGRRDTGPRVEMTYHDIRYISSSPLVKEMFSKSLLIGLCFADIVCWKGEAVLSDVLEDDVR